MENKKKIATITCVRCNKSFSGLTDKQAQRYMQIHKCKGDKK